jgi:hypothetical protein
MVKGAVANPVVSETTSLGRQSHANWGPALAVKPALFAYAL